MNNTKTKTVFEERDELRRNYDRVRAAFESQTIEKVELRNALEAAELELREKETEFNYFDVENEKLRNQLAAAEEALAESQRQHSELRNKFEAAQKVADAAVVLENQGNHPVARIRATAVFDLAIREYRAFTARQQTTVPPCEFKFRDTPCDLGIDPKE